jgi:putative copper resistance protein D
MALEAGLVASRFFHYVALLFDFGAALFPFYSWRGAETGPEVGARALRLILPATALLAIASGAAWFVFAVNTMADSSTGFLDLDTVQYTLGHTDFGHLWTFRAVVACLFLVVALGRSYVRPRSLVLVFLSGVLLFSLAGTGHTQTGSGAMRTFQEGSDGLHLLAAGAWLGGLVPLAVVSARGTRTEAESALARFSGMGYLAVAALFATGVTNGVTLVGSFGGLFSTPYGQLLLLKVALFVLMVALAGLNRLVHVPALVFESRRAIEGGALSRLRRHILLEQLLGLGVIVVVSFLGTMAPPTAAPQ